MRRTELKPPPAPSEAIRREKNSGRQNPAGDKKAPEKKSPGSLISSQGFSFSAGAGFINPGGESLRLPVQSSLLQSLMNELKLFFFPFSASFFAKRVNQII